MFHSNPHAWPKSVCRTSALKVLDGTATRKDRVLAKCGDCMNGFVDGLKDCEAGDWCPMYPDMPYGTAWRQREKKQVSESTRVALVSARQRSKKKKSKAGAQAKSKTNTAQK